MRTPATRPQPSRRALCAAVLLAMVVSLLVATAPASAAASCGRQVIDDWYDDGRVDGTYKLHCYDDAIEILPRDVRDYSSAKEDIERALQAKLRGEPAPPATTDPTPGDSTPPDGPTETTEAPPTGGDDPPTDTTANAPLGDSDSASSVPVPLLILAGLALLLVAGGSAGYLIRRFQNRQIPPPTP